MLNTEAGKFINFMKFTFYKILYLNQKKKWVCRYLYCSFWFWSVTNKLTILRTIYLKRLAGKISPPTLIHFSICSIFSLEKTRIWNNKLLGKQDNLITTTWFDWKHHNITLLMSIKCNDKKTINLKMRKHFGTWFSFSSHSHKLTKPEGKEM